MYQQDQSQKCGEVVFHSFDPVIVQLSLDRSNVQHEKLTLKLVKPYIEGFSITEQPQGDVEMVEEPQATDHKRKTDKQENQKKKRKK